jgi:hypothetical protein
MIDANNVPVNDGKGLYDNSGLCDTLLVDLNNLIKYMANGQYLQFCVTVTGMSQKVINLKKGIKTDMDSLKDNIEELKRMNDRLQEQLTGLPVGKE